MLLPIQTLVNPILRKESMDINKNYDDLDLLINNMKYTLKYVDGVGLAAPQINLNINLFIVSYSDFKKVFINPRLVNIGTKKIIKEEGCLSLPRYKANIKRYDSIRVQYYDEKFNFHDEFYNGLISRIIQHEYDHLKGILILDYKN